MTIKMIVTDLDGTFYHQDLSYDKKRFHKLYALMKKQGIKFVVASGNQYYQLISFFDDHKEMTFVAENGGYVVSEGKELFFTSMKKDTYLNLANVLNAMDVIDFLLICGKQSSYVLSSTPEEECAFYQNYFPKMKKVNDFLEIEDEIMKIALVVAESEVESIEKQLKKVVDEDLSIVTSGQGCIDIIIKGINKGMALNMLMKKWDIKAEEIMVFGDEMNDLEMLEMVKYGFVMANGSELLKEKMRLVLPYTNEEDGELIVIEEYFKDPERFAKKYGG